MSTHKTQHVYYRMPTSVQNIHGILKCKASKDITKKSAYALKTGPIFMAAEYDILNLFSSSEFFWEFFLVFLEDLGWLNGSSMGVCEALM